MQIQPCSRGFGIHSVKQTRMPMIKITPATHPIVTHSSYKPMGELRAGINFKEKINALEHLCK